MATITAIDGYFERSFSRSWPAFQRFVETELPRAHEYIWRGHRQSDWELEPTLDRLWKSANGSPRLSREDVLAEFRRAATGRRGAYPTHLTDEQMWALGQHFGLATPLLDWTKSPYAAAFFAFEAESGPGQTRNRAVFGLHQGAIERASRELAPLLDDPTDNLLVVAPLVDENARLINQGGRFTLTGHGRTVTEWVTRTFVGEEQPILVKLRIADRLRDTILRSLNRMNINALSLFPDLDGAARYVNMSQRISDY